tara:strand:- start:125 stop:295 length:171 start_codon:yes stop_codon:yes gene_type:complete
MKYLVFLIKKAASKLQLKKMILKSILIKSKDSILHPNSAEAIPATAITMPPHLITG